MMLPLDTQQTRANYQHAVSLGNTVKPIFTSDLKWAFSPSFSHDSFSPEIDVFLKVMVILPWDVIWPIQQIHCAGRDMTGQLLRVKLLMGIWCWITGCSLRHWHQLWHAGLLLLWFLCVFGPVCPLPSSTCLNTCLQVPHPLLCFVLHEPHSVLLCRYSQGSLEFLLIVGNSLMIYWCWLFWATCVLQLWAMSYGTMY